MHHFNKLQLHITTHLYPHPPPLSPPVPTPGMKLHFGNPKQSCSLPPGLTPVHLLGTHSTSVHRLLTTPTPTDGLCHLTTTTSTKWRTSAAPHSRLASSLKCIILFLSVLSLSLVLPIVITHAIRALDLAQRAAGSAPVKPIEPVVSHADAPIRIPIVRTVELHVNRVVEPYVQHVLSETNCRNGSVTVMLRAGAVAAELRINTTQHKVHDVRSLKMGSTRATLSLHPDANVLIKVSCKGRGTNWRLVKVRELIQLVGEELDNVNVFVDDSNGKLHHTERKQV